MHNDNHSHNHTGVMPRVNRAIGQLNGLKNMIEKGSMCEDILVQLLALEGAIRNIGKIIITDHLVHCVKKGIEDGESSKMDDFANLLSKFL